MCVRHGMCARARLRATSGSLARLGQHARVRPWQHVARECQWHTQCLSASPSSALLQGHRCLQHKAPWGSTCPRCHAPGACLTTSLPLHGRRT